MASRTLQFCPLSNNISIITMNKYVLVTYFTINIKLIFVQRCLMGNLLSQYFLKGYHCQNSMLFIVKIVCFIVK